MRIHLVALLALAACKSSDDYKEEMRKEMPPPTEKDKPPLPPPARKALTADELGTCTIETTGAVTVKQTTKGGRDATNVSYWLSEEERKNMMGVDGFVVNCHGDNVRFSIIPAGGKLDGMPFKPKKYEFAKGKKPDATVMVAFNDKKSLTALAGSVDVTAFDSHHIAATIDLAGKLSPGGGDVKVTGSFDLVCPGFRGCNK